VLYYYNLPTVLRDELVVGTLPGFSSSLLNMSKKSGVGASKSLLLTDG